MVAKPKFFVVFIHGPAAAGKYTIGRKVSEQLGIPLFHNHLTVDLVKTLFDFGTEPFKTLRANIWHAAFQQASEHKRSFVFTFNPESTVAPELVDELDETVRSHGGVMLYVELKCSDEEVMRRIDSPSRHEFGKLTDAKLYQSFKSEGGFDFPALPKPLIEVDTEVVQPVSAAEAIVTAIRKSV